MIIANYDRLQSFPCWHQRGLRGHSMNFGVTLLRSASPSPPTIRLTFRNHHDKSLDWPSVLLLLEALTSVDVHPWIIKQMKPGQLDPS